MKTALQPMSYENEISIVLPVYNESQHIEKVLQSLYQQKDNQGWFDKKRYEVIIVNNNSTDQTFEIVEAFAYAHSDLNVYTIEEAQQGVAWARKTGMDIAVKRSHNRDAQHHITCPFYIFSADADCCVDEYWLYALYQTMTTSKAAIGICNYYYSEYFQSRPRLWAVIDRILRARQCTFRLFGGFPDGKGFAVSREKYEKIGGIEIFYQLSQGEFVCHLSDDWDFGIKMSAHGERIIYSPESKVEINPRRIDHALADMIQGKAYGENGIITMKNIRNKSLSPSDQDLSKEQAKMLWEFAIKDFTHKNIILPLLLDPDNFNHDEVINFLSPKFRDRLYQRINEIVQEMRIVDFTPIHSYSTPCYRLYLEFAEDLFNCMRKNIGDDFGFPPPLPIPLQRIFKTKDIETFKKFVYYYCEDRESGEAHNYFSNGGVF